MASCKRNFLNVNHGKLGRLKVNLIICKLQCHLTYSFQLGSHSPSYFLQHKLCIVSSKTFGCWVFTNGMTFSNELILRQAGLKLVRPWACSRPKGGIIQSAIDRWSDCIGQNKDSLHLCTLSTILQRITHTMKPSEPLLLPDVTLCCGMYPAGKVDIFQHLAIPRFPQSDHTIGKPSVDAGLLCKDYSSYASWS